MLMQVYYLEGESRQLQCRSMVRATARVVMEHDSTPHGKVRQKKRPLYVI
jgi:hypothetical protein